MSTRIETPEAMAERLIAESPTAFRTIMVEAGMLGAIRARDAQVLAALGFALSHADPFPMLRALASDLGGEPYVCPCPAVATMGRERCGYCGKITANRFGDELRAREERTSPPPTLPGPTEHVDMLLRFRYHRGVFVVPGPSGHLRETSVAHHTDYRVSDLNVRIVYEHSPADAEAATDCGESWRARMMGAGAASVALSGEVGK